MPRSTLTCDQLAVFVIGISFLLASWGSILHAGPNRDCIIVNPSQSAAENMSTAGYSNGNQEFDQNAAGSYTNHGYVRAAKNSYTTYVNGEVIIWFLAASGSWVRAYGLNGADTWTRPLQIVNCELGKFEYEASA